MRWRYLEATQGQDAALRADLIAKIDAWWKTFAAKSQQLNALFKGQAKWDLPEWMAKNLQAIHPRLMWEFGPAVNGSGHRLVITPESAHHLRPLGETILERGPTIPGWEFYAHRLPEDLHATKATVRGRTGYDISDFQVRVTRGAQHRIDVSYFSPVAVTKDDLQPLQAALVATETLLGERCLDRWIGAIEISPSAKISGLRSLFRRGSSAPPRTLPLDRLKETVDSVVGSVLDQLAPRPHYEWVDEAEWTIWQLTPEQRDDYPEQCDLIVGTSVNQEMWSAAHSDALFYSERFSRLGELFCYVKLDNAEGLSESNFADKTEIENALDAVLKPQKGGCTIGGGTGLRYSYIDLAIVDVDRATNTIRRCLQEGRAPKRSWIQFFDVELRSEWIGVYSDSPPPPMPNFDD